MKKSAVMFCVIGLLAVGGCGTAKNNLYSDRNYQTDFNQCWAGAWAAYPESERYDHEEQKCTTTYDERRREKVTTCNTYPVYTDGNWSPRYSSARSCMDGWGWEFNYFDYSGQWAGLWGI